tara:strand:+ start:334 stop:555 length:222 start_codon:yes stop_codon:yes gene_type:complete
VSSNTITLVFCLGGITFLVNWILFLWLNKQKLASSYFGKISLTKTFLVYLLISSIGVLSMGIIFVSALMFAHG